MSGKSVTADCSKVSWRVPVNGTSFGEMLVTDLDGLTMVLYRGIHGWKTIEGKRSHACLPHQLYVADILPIIRSGVEEICAVDINAGIWKTIWASSYSQVSHP